MKPINFKALLASLLAIFALALPAHTVLADEVASTAKVAADGAPADEEATDEELEDSCEDDGVF